MDAWWKQAVFYEIYMPSFADGNNDGIGDFKGITERLDYLKDLGVEGIWLTPFYSSPKVDNGYDIADYYAIDQDYGTMADFDAFLQKAHQLGIKVIVDLVLNHTSAEHDWFVQSKSSKQNPKRDWYIWADPVDGGPPNNWESFFGGSAWEYDEQSGQYYYHAFAKEQVDLNWANKEVKQAMFDVMKFWLDKGVDGFRLDVINYLTVNQSLPDNPYDENGEQIHHYDVDQDGVLDVIEEITTLVKQYDNRFLLGEVGSDKLEELLPYMEDGKLDAVFNFNLGSIETFDVDQIFTQVKEMEENIPTNKMPTLFFSSHDMPRHISRFGKAGFEEDIAKLISTLMLTAKGIPFIYFGDEIGIRNLYADHIADMKDVQGITAYKLAIADGKSEVEALRIANEKGRDHSRSPMQWDDTANAGFSEVTPWIQLSDPTGTISVKSQRDKQDSLFAYYQRLISLKKQYPSLVTGTYKKLAKTDNIIFYIREHNDQLVFVILNFNDQEMKFTEEDLQNYQFVISSRRDFIEVNDSITILPYEAVVFAADKG